MVKTNKKNPFQLRECCVVLTDFRLEQNKGNVGPSRQQQQAAHDDEPDIIEVIDVENFEKNGFKTVQKFLSPTEQLKRFKKHFIAMETRIAALENQLAQQKTSNSIIAPAETNANTDTDADADAEVVDVDVDMNVSGFDSFLKDLSFNTMANALSQSDLDNILQIQLK